MNCHECGQSAYFLCNVDKGPTALCQNDACIAQHARRHFVLIDSGRLVEPAPSPPQVDARTPKPGELWRPAAGGPWVQILDVQPESPNRGVLFDRGGEGVPGEWRPYPWFDREMRPLITLGSKWRFRDGSGNGIEVVGFQSDGVVLDLHAPNPFARAALGQVHWPVREFLLKAVPEASP